MQDPLRKIFDIIYEKEIDNYPMTAEESAVWEEAQKRLGEDQIDEMLASQSRSLVETEYDCFRAGFHLGVQLLLSLR